MMFRLLPFLLALASGRLAAAQDSVPGLKVPPGFVVTQFADHTLANDIYCMTIDPKGRIVVSGRGYIKILVDDDNDGKADRAIDFADSPKDGAMGLLWEKDALYVTGDGGLRRFFDKDGDGKADGPSELIRAIKTGGEHTAHAIKRGPDGWLYVLCGDGAGIDKTYATLPTSPVKDPVGGCVIRFSPDLKGSEVVAHGLRNAYGMDFSSMGDLFTFDSDNERCIGLPWYEPTRFYHVVEGRFYGWLAPQHATFWRMPPYFLDVMPPVCYLGRGSPTGVVCYNKGHFPENYHHGVFVLDWTFGKVYYLSLDEDGSTFATAPKVFLEAEGDHGFAPTAAVVHPENGDLYISVGGRGTRGGVYRVSHPENRGRTGAPPLKKGFRAGAALVQLKDLNEIRRELARGDFKEFDKALHGAWNSQDRNLRWAAIALLRDRWSTWGIEERKRLESDAKKHSQRLVLAAALIAHDPEKAFSLSIDLLDSDLNRQIVLDGLRLLEVLLGDIGNRHERGTYKEGYSLRREKLPAFLLAINRQEQLIKRLAPLWNIDPDWDTEILRILAMLNASGPDAEKILESQSVYAIYKKMKRGKRDLTRTAHAVMAATVVGQDRFLDVLTLQDDADATRMPRESNWILRLKEVFRDGIQDPKTREKAFLFIVERWLYSGVPFLDVDEAPIKVLAPALLEEIKRGPSYPLTPGVLRILKEAPARDVAPLLRKRVKEPGVALAVLPILARRPEINDYPLFVDGLLRGGPATVEACLMGLQLLPPPKEEAAESFALFRCLSSVPAKDVELHKALLARLALITGQKDLGPNPDAWRLWFRKTHPKLAARLENPDGVDLPAWEKRLARIDWDKGNAERGQKVFAKASCALCHAGSSMVGPDLVGVAGRFARADLFTAILQPSRDVADRYRMTLVETKEGKVHQGLVIYDALDSLLLHTPEGTTVRLLGGDIAQRRQVDVSPMPAGLLERLSDEDVADLYAYLRGKK